jgi:hypothetical protein
MPPLQAKWPTYDRFGSYTNEEDMLRAVFGDTDEAG